MSGSNDVSATRNDDSEIRFFADAASVAVLDGYCSANGCNRTDVMRQLLSEFSAKKLHEATVILRVAKGHPTAPEGERK